MTIAAVRVTDVLIVGGGLAGLVAANEASTKHGMKIILVDSPLSQADGMLGGFARFSGAKFSLPPAGLGLVPIAGSRARLEALCQHVIELMEIDKHRPEKSKDVASESLFAGQTGAQLRQYESIVLNPEEITKLIRAIETKNVLAGVETITGSCSELHYDGRRWVAELAVHGQARAIQCQSVVIAAGRASGIDLANVGASPTTGKGIDVGYRVEFLGRGLEKLREIGPDAKILHGSCRTFCLNVPGKIFNHKFRGIDIPGGIVADKGTLTSNVGVLCRLEVDKSSWLDEFFSRIAGMEEKLAVPLRSTESTSADLYELLSELYGGDVASRLIEFTDLLGRQGLVDWGYEHNFHMPLLDWYWETFAQPCSFQTSLPSLYVIGDQSGHARGLLQAAVSGVLVAEELAQNTAAETK